MLLSQRWEIGVLEALIRPDILPLFIGGWLCLFLGGGAQLLLLKKCTGPGRWAVVFVVLAAVVVCEAGVRIMGGWDGVLFAVVGRLCWYPLLGAALGWILWRVKRHA